jgi:transcriptional regulator with XRE-family HTH domain
MTIQELFIANLKRYRKAEHLSQEELAFEIDSSQTYISEIEVGKKFPSLEMVERISNILGIESWKLFQMEAQDETELGFSPPDGLCKDALRARLNLAIDEVVDALYT